MHYHEAAAFLFDLRRFSVKPGTERVAALLDQGREPGRRRVVRAGRGLEREGKHRAHDRVDPA